jgi:hypothetical protein
LLGVQWRSGCQDESGRGQHKVTRQGVCIEEGKVRIQPEALSVS